MSKKKIHILLVVFVCSSFIVFLAWLLLSVVFGGPLSGTKRHSFGVVPIERPSQTFTHTYQLVNRTDHVLVLADVVPSCGCTTSDWTTNPVESGELIEIPVNLKLSKSQLRSSKVRLEFETGEVEMLYIDGTGRFVQPMSISPLNPILYYDSAKGTRAVLRLEWSKESAPPRPTVTLPVGMYAEYDDWILSKEADPHKGIPELRTIRMKLFLESEEVETGEFVITLKDTPEFVVPFSVEEDEPIGISLD